MNEKNKTENEAENRMNETENSQTEESEPTYEFPFNLIRKSPRKAKINKLSNKEWSTKDTGSKELGNEKIPDVNKKLSFTIFQLEGFLPKSSRTSRLWINYMNYINIVKTSIRAETTSNLHLLPT